MRGSERDSRLPSLLPKENHDQSPQVLWWKLARTCTVLVLQAIIRFLDAKIQKTAPQPSKLDEDLTRYLTEDELAVVVKEQLARYLDTDELVQVKVTQVLEEISYVLDLLKVNRVYFVCQNEDEYEHYCLHIDEVYAQSNVSPGIFPILACYIAETMTFKLFSHLENQEIFSQQLAGIEVDSSHTILAMLFKALENPGMKPSPQEVKRTEIAKLQEMFRGNRTANREARLAEQRLTEKIKSAKQRHQKRRRK